MKQEEIQKLSDRDLLVKTFGTVEWLKGVMGNGGGVLEDIRRLQEAQKRYVTYWGMMITIGLLSIIVGVLLYFL